MQFKKFFEKNQIFKDLYPDIRASLLAFYYACLMLWLSQSAIIVSRVALWRVKKLLFLQILYELSFSAILAISLLIFTLIFYTFSRQIIKTPLKPWMQKCYASPMPILFGIFLFESYYLRADFENIALRLSEVFFEHAPLLQELILFLMILIISLGLIIYFWGLSLILNKIPIQWIKFALIPMGFGFLWWNELFLINDYFRIHFYVVLVGFLTFYSLFYHLISNINQKRLIQDGYQVFTHKILFLFLFSLLALIQKPSHLVLANMSKFESNYGMRLLAHFGYGKSKAVGIISEVQKSNISGIDQRQHQLDALLNTDTTKDPKIVILLTIDSLKADVFEQKNQGLGPLFELKKHALFFNRVYTSSTSTRFSLGSLFFGRYPSHLIWKRDSATHPSLEKETRISLAQELSQHRVKTLIFNTSKDLYRDQYGVNRGFDRNFFVPQAKGQKTALSNDVIAKMIAELKKIKDNESVFLFSHLLDAHHPFDAQKKTGTPYQRYLSELSLVSQSISTLINWIKDRPDRDRYYLLISADHGQGFGQHRVKFHNGPPFEHQIRVPLWFYAPKYENQSNFEKINQTLDQHKITLSSIDLFPTILSLFHLKPSSQVQGLNLAHLMLNLLQQSKEIQIDQISQLINQRQLLSVNWHTRALISPSQQMKIIEDTQLNQIYLFDLKNDKMEKNNLCESTQIQWVQKCDQWANDLRLMIEYEGQQPSEF